MVNVHEWIVADKHQDTYGEALTFLGKVERFDFVFLLHLMHDILRITNKLSLALQRSDQDIVNALYVVKACKARLQIMRDDSDGEFNIFLDEVCIFCDNNNIAYPDMRDPYVPKRSQHVNPNVSNHHHYRVNVFIQIIDFQLEALHSCFDEGNSELLLCMSWFSPVSNFEAFKLGKLVRFAQFYPQEFSGNNLSSLKVQLKTYNLDVRGDERFSSLQGMSDLAKKFVATGKNSMYNLVYELRTLALVLPVATASVEREFSVMNIVKKPLRNKMGD